MGRAKKDGKFVNFYLDKSLSDKIDVYSEETAVPKTKVVEHALEAFFEKEEKRQPEKILENEK